MFTWVSVNFKLFDSCVRLETDKYLLRSNSDSSDFICATVNAVRGRFFLSSVNSN